MSCDWPLSREEKTFRLLQLYAKDVKAVDELFESGEAQLKSLPTGSRNSKCTRLSDASTAATEVTPTDISSGCADSASAERLRLAVEEATAALRALLPEGPPDAEELDTVGRSRCRSEGARSNAATVRGSPARGTPVRGSPLRASPGSANSRRSSGSRQPSFAAHVNRRRRSRGAEAEEASFAEAYEESSCGELAESDACQGDCEFEDAPRRKILFGRKPKPKQPVRAKSCHATVTGAFDSHTKGVARAMPLMSLEEFLGESVQSILQQERDNPKKLC